LAKEIKAHLAVLSANLLFGVNYTAVQFITQKFIQPFGLNLIRVTVSSLLFWFVALFYRSGVSIKRKDFGRFFLCAMTGIVINQLLFIKGLSMTLVIHGALLSLVTPILITFIAAYFLKEKPGVYKIIGLTLGISGALMLILRREGSGNGDNILTGDLFIVINAISYSFYFVIVKPLMKEYQPLNVLRWVFTLALPFMFLFGWKQFREIQWQVFTAKEYLALTLIVVGATFLAYTFNLYSIQKLGAGITGAYIYTQPVFATLIAVFILHESLSLYKIAAALLIIAGVFLTSRKGINNKGAVD
jgi:drug/metabolite transporter (DMT)-like permease